jgi:asparagine synthase (glutamine-hydrolysing)
MSTPAPDTMFAGIHKLPPATWLRMESAGRAYQHCYWDVWQHAPALENVSQGEIVERLLQEMRAAVDLRKVSDVPVGVFLSGGIDSSTNVALFAQGERGPLKTFTIAYDDAYPTNPTETSYARQVAGRFGAQYHERLLSVDDLLDFLPRMIYLQDEPIADPVCVPLFYLSELARANGVTVCQVGEGADELFHGYPGWERLLRLERMMAGPLGGVKALSVRLGLRCAGRSDAWFAERLRRRARGEQMFWAGGGEAFTHAQKQRLLSPRLRKRFAGRTSWAVIEPYYRAFRQSARDRSPLNWMTYVDLKFRLPETLLMRVDKMSMAVGLEARVPFLDHRLVELAMGIPARLKAGRGGELKRLLKQAMRGLLPDAIIDRPKQGFGVPIHDWFLDRLGERARAELMSFCAETDYFDTGEVRRLLESRQSQQAWCLLNFALWWREFIGSSSAAGQEAPSRAAA